MIAFIGEHPNLPLKALFIHVSFFYLITMNNKRLLFGQALLCLVFLFQHFNLHAQSDVFPGETWARAAAPEDLGFDSGKLARARAFADSIPTAAVMIVSGGMIVDEWGAVEEKYHVHSIRKSLISAMFGKYVQEGVIDLDKSLEEIGIDDDPPLTELQRTATIRDVMKNRSGIFREALLETDGMAALRPQEMTVRPGTFWYYNNWDFNAAGTIFVEQTGLCIFDGLKQDIADPIGMEHFEPGDGFYAPGPQSIHPGYPFTMTARDLGRFGLLMLREGRWGDQQVIPRDWVRESTRYHSDASLYYSSGYGYMWWVARDHNKFSHMAVAEVPEGTYSARGYGGHVLTIIPEYDLVVVHRVDTFDPANRVVGRDLGTLMQMILDART
jgi:CubicO group peptidase (beta-lactamase class C family)